MAQSFDVSLKVLFAIPGDGIIRRSIFRSRVTGRMCYCSAELTLRYRRPIHQTGLYVALDPMRIDTQSTGPTGHGRPRRLATGDRCPRQ